MTEVPAKPARGNGRPRKLRFTRSLAVLRLRRQLEQRSYPRIQMAFIVALTGAFGLLVSFLLLNAGVGSMALRYPLALAAAYLFFFFLLWLWLRTRAGDYADLLELDDLLPEPGLGDAEPTFHGGGGGFGGAGAGASFDGPANAPEADPQSLLSVGDAADAAFDGDELAIPILALALAVGLALASLYVVYLAPVFFAELLLDGVLSYSLYRHLRTASAGHWLQTALRRTVVPFALTAVFLALAGAARAAYVPGARSIGEVVRHFDRGPGT